jgi:hypothetical protein
VAEASAPFLEACELIKDYGEALALGGGNCGAYLDARQP